MKSLLSAVDLNTYKMEVGKIYEIEYIIPDKDVVDYQALQKDLTQIHTNLINSPQFKYVGSKLIGTSFKIQIQLRPQTAVSGLGILPVVIYVGAFAVVTALAVLGLKWSVNSIKEISAPVTDIAKSFTPILLVIGAIVIIPNLVSLLPKKR